jgi:hypothetical protein
MPAGTKPPPQVPPAATSTSPTAPFEQRRVVPPRATDRATRRTSLIVLAVLGILALLLFAVPRLLGGDLTVHPPGTESVAGRHASPHLGITLTFPKGWRHLVLDDVVISNVTTGPIYGTAPLALDTKALTIFNLSELRLATYYRGPAPPDQQAGLIIGFARASGAPHWKTNVGTTDSLVNYGATLLAKSLPSAGISAAPRCENANLSTTVGRCVLSLDPHFVIAWFAAARDGYIFAVLHSRRPLPEALAEGDALMTSLLAQ